MPNEFKVNIALSPSEFAEGAVKIIDGVAQIGERREQQKLKTQALAQEIQEATQKSEREQQIHYFDLEKRRLDLEVRRVELKKQELELQMQELETQEKELDFKKKQFETLLGLAERTVDFLNPGADPETRTLEIRDILPTLLSTFGMVHQPLLLDSTLVSEVLPNEANEVDEADENRN